MEYGKLSPWHPRIRIRCSRKQTCAIIKLHLWIKPQEPHMFYLVHNGSWSGDVMSLRHLKKNNIILDCAPVSNFPLDNSFFLQKIYKPESKSLVQAKPSHKSLRVKSKMIKSIFGSASSARRQDIWSLSICVCVCGLICALLEVCRSLIGKNVFLDIFSEKNDCWDEVKNTDLIMVMIMIVMAMHYKL